MRNGIYYYKLQSPYPEDITKNCKLTINEIDSNFFNLKSYDIESAEFIREEKTLVLTRVNGDKLIVDLSDMVYDLQANANCTESGVTLTMHYDGKNGEKDIRVDNLITLDMLRNKIEELIGTDILTKVITDGTLKGYGTLDSPLGLNGTEKTGQYAPVISRLDLTDGDELPEVAKLGTRYATVEYVNDYGYLYNGAGVQKISDHVEEEGRGWRVPSKEDWDAMLNLIEPCENRNHDSASCHRELGMVAGKYLKSACGWVGQPICECGETVPDTGCTIGNGSETTGEYIEDTDDYGVPETNLDGPQGVDKYGMNILPVGVAVLDGYGRPQYSSFREKAAMWTTSFVHGDVDQDKYVKVFDWNKAGVTQVAECPTPYYGVRLVKDYDGSNYFDTEYIDGVPYKTILFPEIRQIWLASNYAKKEGFVEYTAGGEVPEVLPVNNGEVNEKRKAVFLNEWNGCYWEKKELQEGDTVVVQNPCMTGTGGETTNICWKDELGVENCVEVVMPELAQHNIEYRVFTINDTCDQDLINTDWLAIERLLRVVVPMIEKYKKESEDRDHELQLQIDEINVEISGLTDALNEEISARTAADEALDAKIDAEIERATSAETKIAEDLAAEIERAKDAENQLHDDILTESGRATSEEARIEAKLDAEIERSMAADSAFTDALDAEIERAKAAEDEISGLTIDTSKDYIMSASTESNYNLVLESKDGIEDHFVKIKFDGDFGEI